MSAIETIIQTAATNRGWDCYTVNFNRKDIKASEGAVRIANADSLIVPIKLFVDRNSWLQLNGSGIYERFENDSPDMRFNTEQYGTVEDLMYVSPSFTVQTGSRAVIHYLIISKS